MALEFHDRTEQPRSNDELLAALKAIQQDFVQSEHTPIKIHYTVIMDALAELIEIRRQLPEAMEKVGLEFEGRMRDAAVRWLRDRIEQIYPRSVFTEDGESTDAKSATFARNLVHSLADELAKAERSH
jgi:hypothetical protein